MVLLKVILHKQIVIETYFNKDTNDSIVPILQPDSQFFIYYDDDGYEVKYI